MDHGLHISLGRAPTVPDPGGGGGGGGGGAPPPPQPRPGAEG
ncbi:hypothetical protein [Nocardia abscessus]|nr:hypothetical protein [Nocardia abscessus]